MITFLFKILLTLNSLCLFGAVFLINKNVDFLHWLLPDKYIFSEHISYLVYFIISIGFARFTIWIVSFLDGDIISKGTITFIEPANGIHLPVYLGYFFVALSINDFDVFAYIFAILCLFSFLAETLYFNPLYLLFGYHFYYATSNKNIKVLIITQQNFKDPKLVQFKTIKRINNFTFMDIGEADELIARES